MKRRIVLVALTWALWGAVAPLFGMKLAGTDKKTNEYAGKLVASTTPTYPAGPTTPAGSTAPEVVAPDE